MMSLLTLVPTLFHPSSTGPAQPELDSPSGSTFKLAQDSAHIGLASTDVKNKDSLFPQLALELQFAILSHLSRSSILALSLTHPSFTPTCAPYLWRTLHLQPSSTASHTQATLRPRLTSLLATLRANPSYAAHVRTLNVELGAGEFADGTEWATVGEIAALLPDIREIDLRSDSVGRWKGIWDPFLRVVLERGHRWERLERVSVSALVGEGGLVRRWLEWVGGSVKHADLSLTQITSAYASHQVGQGQGPGGMFQWDVSLVGNEEDWTLAPVKVPPPSPDQARMGGGLLPRMKTYRGSVSTLASILATVPDACPDLETVILECGHPFGEDARNALAEEIETTLVGRGATIKKLALNGGVRVEPGMVERVARAVGEGLEVLEMGDPIGFYYKPPLPPLSTSQLTSFPTLKSLSLRAWGYFDTALLSSLALAPWPTADPHNPITLAAGQERVTLVSFQYDVQPMEDGEREAAFKGVSDWHQGEYPEWMWMEGPLSDPTGEWW